MLGSLLGGIASSALSLFGKNKEAKMQKQFAKNGIQWKVEDAKKAGVHPLYALGANTVSYSPVGVGDSFGWLSDMGQEIDRSRMATSGRETRRMEAALGSLSLERAGLENDLLRAEIAKTRGQVGPPVPAGGRGLVPEDLVKPQRTDGLNIGVGFRTNPSFVDAQTVEDRYGDSELLSMAIALVNGAADLRHNWPRIEGSAANWARSQPAWVKRWPSAGVGRFAGRR